MEQPIQGRTDIGKEIAKLVFQIAGEAPCRKVLGLDIPTDEKDLCPKGKGNIFPRAGAPQGGVFRATYSELIQEQSVDFASFDL